MTEVLRERCAAGAPVVFSSHQLDLVERLCDRVGIVAGGRLVAAGTVDELRAGAAVALVVDAPAAGPGWADGLPGVVGSRVEQGRTVVALRDADVDDQPVLAAALSTGPVREFRRRRASLTDLFRDVVAAPQAAPAADPARAEVPA